MRQAGGHAASFLLKGCQQPDQVAGSPSCNMPAFPPLGPRDQHPHLFYSTWTCAQSFDLLALLWSLTVNSTCPTDHPFITHP